MKPRLVPAQVPNRLLGVAWALVLGFLFVLAIDSFVTTPGGDSSIYTYVAKGMLQGEIPYLDRWDNKGPLFYVINLIGLVIHKTWGQWVVQGLFLLGSTGFAFLLLRRSLGFYPRCSLSQSSWPITTGLRRQATIRNNTVSSFNS